MGKLLCLLNLHAWSAFLHIPSRCVDERFCKNCQKTESDSRHRWEKWADSKQESTSWVDGEIKVVGITTTQQRFCADCHLCEIKKRTI